MDDLTKRLRQIEANRAPDLWEEIVSRHPGTPQAGTPRERLIAALVATVVAVAAIGFLVNAFDSFGSDRSATTGQGEWVKGEIESLGASFQYPSTWHLQPFDEPVGDAAFTGAVVSNASEDLHHPDLGGDGATSTWDLSELRPDGVVVSIEDLAALLMTTSPDSQFPLALADAEQLGRTRHSGDAEGLWLPFWLNGRHLGARVYFGPEASEDDRQVAADIVASIRPKQMGDAGADPTILVSSSGPSGDQALLTGTLTAEDGCLAVSTGTSSVYVVWPAGYSLSEEKGGTWLADESGTLVAKIGDEVQMGGGITNLAHAEPGVVGGIPSSCEVGGPDAYWFAGTPEAVLGSLVPNGAADRDLVWPGCLACH